MNLSSFTCKDNIWNENLFNHEKFPIFSNCFQYLILLPGPIEILVGYIFFFIGKYFQWNVCKKFQFHSQKFLHITKMLLPILSAFFLMIEILVEHFLKKNQDTILVISYGILMASMIIAALTIELGRQGHSFLRVVAFIYFWLTFGGYAFRFYDNLIKFLKYSTKMRMIYFSISSVIMILIFLTMIMDSMSCFYAKDMTENPENFSSVLSQITYVWMDKYIYRWFKEEMIDETSYDLNNTETSLINSEKCLKYFKYNLQNQNKSELFETNEKKCLIDEKNINEDFKRSGKLLMKSLFQVYFPITFCGWILKILRDILILTLPLVLKLLLSYLKKKDISYTWKGISLAFLFLFQGLIGSILENYCWTITTKITVRVRASLCGMIYKKTLRLSTEARSVHSSGDIINMVSVDMEQIMNAITYSWIFISCPFQIILAILLLYLELGYSIFAGVTAIGAIIPLNIIVMKFIKTFSENELLSKDKRIGILTEIIHGMKVIKMYAWEKCFNKKIESIRKDEIKSIRNVSAGWCILSVLFDLVPFFVMYITFTFYIYFVPNSSITPEKIFVCLVLFNNLQMPILVLPWGFSQAISAYVSFGRIENFLLASEKEYDSDDSMLRKMNPDASIDIQNGSFSWTEDGRPILNNINLIVEKQKLIAIVGRVGVGKSSLLSAILGEMYTIGGAIQTQGKMAYVPQEAWIQNNTLKNNILCTKSCNEIFYNKVLEACCLGYDIKALPNQDKTEIGERGVNLSGGQKQRVNLARAVYQDCDIYLLDDPLSAVDVNVGQTLFSKLISNQGLLKSKTRILVTHGLKWLPFVDEICVINDQGEISERGSYEYLMDCGTEFKLFVNESPDKVDKIQNAIMEPSGLDKRKQSRRATSGSQGFEGDANASENNEKYFNDISNEEEIMSGRVSLRSIFWYFKSAGICVIASSIFACIAFGVFQSIGNVWLGRLADTQSKLNNSVSDQARDNAKYYINTYGIIGLGQLVVAILFWGGFTVGSLRASKKIHSVILDNVLKATLQFCDATPSGRILNIFTKDLFIIDHILNLNITDIINRTVLLITSLVVISIVTPWFGIIGIPILISYILLQVFYISSSRQARRLDSKASSFVLTHLMETYSGCSIIRSLEAESDFESIQYRHIDKSNKFKLIQYLSLRWLCLRLDILGSLIVFASVIFAVLNRFSLTASLIGLSISYALQVTEILNWLTRQCSEFETNTVSIERIRQYTMIPVESINDTNKHLSENWVSNGNINVENFSLQYNIKLPCVLKNITVSINGGEKIGVVGRTGAGKSTLVLSLFRLIEGSSGTIFIDGVNINSIGLHQLRKQLTILPQDPVIFSGTLKQNLDPFDEYTDDKLLKTLEISGMLDWVNSLTEGMNYDCGNMGTNLSMGQKQLICLARTLLKKSKIIILDEATASVDEETDRRIIEAIKSEFTNSTVIIIAHRLKTIIDCDKIIYLDNGSVIEFGPPRELLSKSSGHFKALAMANEFIKDEENL